MQMNCHKHEPLVPVGRLGFQKLGQSLLQLPLPQRYATEALREGPARAAEGCHTARWRFIAAHFKYLYRKVFHSVKILFGVLYETGRTLDTFVCSLLSQKTIKTIRTLKCQNWNGRQIHRTSTSQVGKMQQCPKFILFSFKKRFSSVLGHVPCSHAIVTGYNHTLKQMFIVTKKFKVSYSQPKSFRFQNHSSSISSCPGFVRR